MFQFNTKVFSGIEVNALRRSFKVFTPTLAYHVLMELALWTGAFGAFGQKKLFSKVLMLESLTLFCVSGTDDDKS